MAIGLPQGRFTNISDAPVRSLVGERTRILAVGGHVNTFKLHTGTKPSVLFLQQWNDDKKSKHYCPKVEDYPIFFAMSERSGKDNSGEYLCKLREASKAMLDDHGYLVIDHDLDEIADAFVDFARQQKFSFWQESYVMSNLQIKPCTDTWIVASWNEYLHTIADPNYEQAKGYHYQGHMRVEMSPVGHDHSHDHSEDDGTISLAVNLFGIAKAIPLKILPNCSYRKAGVGDCQPDVS